MKTTIITRCHSCANNLVLNSEQSSTTHRLYQCSWGHCFIWFNINTRRIDQFAILVDQNNKTYLVSGLRDKYTQLHLQLKYADIDWASFQQGSDWDFKVLLHTPHYKELYIKDNIVQGNELFQKMQTLLTFS